MNIQEFRQQYPQYDSLSDDELGQALHKKYYSNLPYDEFATKFGIPSVQQSVMDSYQRTGPQQALDATKAAGTGLAKGVTALFGAPGDAVKLGQELAQKYSGSQAEPYKDVPWTSDQINRKLGLTYKPKTDEEKYLEAGGAGVGGMLGMGAKAGGAILGLASGLAGEGAAQATHDDPMMRFGGSMAPFAALSYWGLRTPNVVRATQRAMGEVGDEALMKADAVRKMASERLGVPTLLSQGMDVESPLSAITTELARSPQGATIRKVLERQLPVGQQNIDELVQSIAGRPPSQEVANDALGAAKDAFKEARANKDKAFGKGPMGVIFPSTTRQVGRGNFDEMGQIFDPKRFSPDNVEFVAQSLSQQDPMIWNDLVRQHMESVAGHLNKTSGGRLPQSSLENWANAVDSPNFIAGMRGVAQANGADPDAVADGTRKLFDALRVISRERASVGQSDMGEFRRLAGSNVGSAIAKSANPITPFWRTANAVERVVRGNTYKKLSEAITSPDGLRMLQEFKNFDVGDERLINTVRALVTMDAVQEAK